MLLRQAVIGDIEAISHIESLCFPKAEAATYEQFKERFNAFSENFLVLEDKDVIGSKSFANESGVADLTSTGTYFGNWDSVYCENVIIVGNVFKSPELLEGDK